MSNRDTGNGIQQLDDYEKCLTDEKKKIICMIFFQIHETQFMKRNSVSWRAKAVQASISILEIWECLTVTIERIIVNATVKLFFSSGQNQSKQANDPVD